MRHSLRAHIVYLETAIQSLRDQLTKPSLSVDQVEDFQLQLTLAESALEHYHKAYALEQSVVGPEPPNRIDADSKGETSNPKSRNGEWKKEGLSAVGRRMKNRIRAEVLAGFLVTRMCPR